MSERDNNVHIGGDVIGSNVNSDHARVGDVQIIRTVDRDGLIRRLDALHAELRAANAPASAVEAVNDLREQAEKPKPSKDVTRHLLGKLNDPGLTNSIKGLADAFDALS